MLSPTVRLMLSFKNDLDKDTGLLFNQATLDRFIHQQNLALQRRDALVKSVFVVNFLIVLLVSKIQFSLPTFDINVFEIPFLLNLLLLSSSLSFLFLNYAFINEQCYRHVVAQYGVKQSGKDGLDPDFFNASNMFFEFAHKIFRPSFKIYGEDYFISGKQHREVSAIITIALLFSVFLLLSIHLIILGSGLFFLRSTDDPLLMKVVVFVITISMNLIGIMMQIASGKSMAFHINPKAHNQKT